MKTIFTLVLIAMACLAAAAAIEDEIESGPVVAVSTAVETRCGWFSNPTPANAWLNDKDGEWIIAVQGGFQADGDWPNFKDNQWIKTNVHYGYGCACMKVTTDRTEKRILKITSGYARPLSACRKDKALRRAEPQD